MDGHKPRSTTPIVYVLLIACFATAFVPGLFGWPSGYHATGVVDAAYPVVMFAGLTLLVARSLTTAAENRGHGPGWSAMAILGPVGVIVVYCLPDRTTRPPRGFPIEPTPK